MFTSALAGFVLSFSMLLAIGAQNAFVLRQGLRGQHVLLVTLTCSISDAILISIGVAGFTVLDQLVPQLAPVMRWAGAIFLFVYGLLSFRAAFKSNQALDPTSMPAMPLRQAILTVLALTWLNPHVYLDTVILLGSISAQYGDNRWPFGIGAVAASFAFFFGLGYGARFLRPFFARPSAWRMLEFAVGVIMWAIALKLILG